MVKLQANNISKYYDGECFIKDINIHINKNEIVSIIGTSGVGKTTLFNILSGISNPSSGNVLLDGEDVTNKPGKVSYMLQDDILLPYRTIIDNVALPLLIKGIKKSQAHNEVIKYFETFGLSGYEKKWPSQLSGGMIKRAALLRTYLCAKDGIALLDEPFSALDEITKQELHLWYLDIAKKIGLTLFFITHSIDEAIFLSDRVYIIGGKPATITSEIKINKENFDKYNFLLTTEFLKYKSIILNNLGYTLK